MIEKACILGVDDDAINQLVLKEFLGDEYEMSLCSDGIECLDYLKNETPDVILMDVSMPGLSGLETCEKLRRMPNCRELPVIFVSSLASKEDKIAGYQAGGDDYLTKPFEESELKNKINLLLKNKERAQKLKESSDSACNTAMLSMTNMSELGLIIEFLTNMQQAKTPQELAKFTIQSLKTYGHQCSVLMSLASQTMFVTSEDDSNSVEQKVMERAKDKGRIIEYGSRLVFNGERVSLLVRNMVFDDEKTGRLRDHLAAILEGLDASLKRMDLSGKLDHSQTNHHQIKNHAVTLLGELKQSHQDQQKESSSIFSDLNNDLDEMYHQLGLSEEQENQLDALVSAADKKMNHLFELGEYLDAKLEKIIIELDS